MFSHFINREPVLAWTATLLAFAIVPFALLLLVDPRTVDDVSVWLKPLKFAISLCIFTATLTWFAGWLPLPVVNAKWYRPYVLAVVAAIGLQMLWLTVASVWGDGNHFRQEQTLMSAMYPMAGMLAAFLTTITIVYAIVLAVDRDTRLGLVFRDSLVLGLLLTFILTLTVAGAMVSGGGQPGGPATSHQGFLGWLLNGTDLRGAHFLATHAMHLIPLMGWLLARRFTAPVAGVAVWLVAAGYTGFVVYLLSDVVEAMPVLTAMLDAG